jgi:hypothetical protein
MATNAAPQRGRAAVIPSQANELYGFVGYWHVRCYVMIKPRQVVVAADDEPVLTLLVPPGDDRKNERQQDCGIEETPNEGAPITRRQEEKD